MSNPFDHGYALLVGVGQCAEVDWSLPTTVRDTRALREVLVSPDACAYPPDHLRVLNDDGATRQGILDGLAWLKERATADTEATVVVYFSGHGFHDPEKDRYCLITHDTRAHKMDSKSLPATVFTTALRAIPAQRLVVFLDCCHAAAMAKPKSAGGAGGDDDMPDGFAKSAPPPNLIDDLKQGQGRAVFSSSRDFQRSYLRQGKRMSVYTYRLLQALQGAGNKPRDTLVYLSNVMGYVGRMVARDAEARGLQQTPFYKLESVDFPLAVLRGGKGLPAGGWGEVEAETESRIDQLARTAGARSVHGKVTNSTIVTGDHNAVLRGKYNVNIGKARGVAIGDGASAGADDGDDGDEDEGGDAG